MPLFMILAALGMILGILHFGFPLGYYAYLKTFLSSPWNLKMDQTYRPKVTIMISTYNEASTINERLRNLYEQDYLRSLLDVIVVDDASNDKTVELVNSWALAHREIGVKLICEPTRSGKVHAMNKGLVEVQENSEILVLTDADCLWENNAVKEAVKYLADKRVGAVTCTIFPMKLIDAETSRRQFDVVYRGFNNKVRVAESKLWSTPIAHGPFIAYRQKCLKEIGGIPSWGIDDCTPFTLIALNGYRAVQVPDVLAFELAPASLSENIKVRLKRARLLVSHFAGVLRTMAASPAPNAFRRIVGVEVFLHTVNPWLLISSGILLMVGLWIKGLTLLTLLGLFLALVLIVAVPQLNVWILAQLFLAAATILHMLGRELVTWTPVRPKHRGNVSK